VAPGKRRFIAGAVCPRCRALDRVVVELVSENIEKRECVDCGHAEEMRLSGSRTPPPGRLDRRGSSDDDAQVVRIVDPKL